MMIDNFKFGMLEGVAGIAVLVAVALAVVLLLVVIIVNACKVLKERRDEKEDKAEDEFYAEYGITGEELRLNERLTRKRDLLREKGVYIVEEEQAPVQEQAEEPQEEKVEEPVEEPQPEPEPVKELEPEPQPEPEPVKEPEPEPQPEPEPVKEPEPEPQPEPEPVKEPEPEEPVKTGVDKPKTKKIVKKKPDDWSKYDGEYEGYYYDPEDACYYEGTPSPALAKKLAAYQAQLEEQNANKDKKVIIKKVAPPFAALKTPKNARKKPHPVAGFDEAVIYGKYVIEHVDKEDGTQEYFYTLYDANGESVYESANYSTLEYCKRAIVRLKSHAIVGQYTIETDNGGYCVVLKRKSYVHKGAPQPTLEAANANMRKIKSYIQTDIIREQ